MVGVQNNNIQKCDLGQIPSIPHVLLKLLESCHKPGVSFEELSTIIQTDAGLCAKLISAADSSAHTRWSEIKSFDRLLVILGLDTIKTIAITSAVHHFFSQFNTTSGRWLGRFWRYSFGCACAAKRVARLTGYESTDEAHLAGLLHQIGGLIFLRQEPDRYPELLQSAGDEQALGEAEQRLFGVSGNELSAQLLWEWDPDSMLSDALRYQREPAERILETPRLVRLINFSHKLSTHTTLSEAAVQEAGLLFALPPPVVEDLVAGVRSDIAKAADDLGLALDPDAGADQEYCADGEEVRLALARRVREFALLNGVEQHLAGSSELEDALNASLQDLKLLFGLNRGICFIAEPTSGVLRPQATNCARPEVVREFQLRMKPGRSLPADASLGNQLLSSFDQHLMGRLSIVDMQLIKLLGTEGMLCIPLGVGTEVVGVLTAGLSSVDLGRLQQQTNLLHCLAEAVARTLHQRLRLTRSRDEALAFEREQKQTHIHKLAHEASNPLAIIKNYLQVLSMRLGSERGVQEQLTILSEEIERVADIILRMRDFSPSVEVVQGTVDINELLRDLMGIFRVSHFTSRGIKSDIQTDPGMPPILTSRNSLKQILTNLIKNAVEAMPEGGVLTVTSRDRINIDGAQYVELTVADSGPGIPPEMLDSVFRPVKSSKGGVHSGLGLTIVKNLVSEIHGSISCRNRSSGGAEFTIHLPRNLESA